MICILAISQRESFLKIRQSARKTIRRKFNRRKGNRVQELKGTNTVIGVGKIPFNQIFCEGKIVIEKVSVINYY